eukprot:CAMPEP_0202977578 /NCGR_PEP_ID=MMETSP1396-20130829/84327_1 /ASSEMBLY_ACC=CAM_ASM_000872 /TAXON_ID= /ORGANISM="Pseudokeronopsis sp., Strain Brazil" /LENGTH=60 /DNA_ID=CAMNT_0049716341 /DNA_START=894 /DNA_END=1076 /DNA_ORIENTATION=-
MEVREGEFSPQAKSTFAKALLVANSLSPKAAEEAKWAGEPDLFLICDDEEAALSKPNKNS